MSETGEDWHVITDTANTRIVINQLAVDTQTVYGIGDKGIYRFDTHGSWEQISSEIPDAVISFAVVNNGLYSVTQQHGIFYMSLGEEYYNNPAHEFGSLLGN